MRIAFVASASWFAMLLAAGLATAAPQTDAVKLKEGARCEEQTQEAFEGETHRCYFAPRRVGARDFSKRNGRAQFVATVLGPECTDIEILGDGPSPRVATDGSALAQVSVRCSD